MNSSLEAQPTPSVALRVVLMTEQTKADNSWSSWASWTWTQLSDESSPFSFILGNSVDMAVQYGLDTSFGFIQTVCAIIGAVSVTSAAKKALYPQARPVEPLFNRLRSEGGPRLWSHQRVRFAVNPYKNLNHNRIVILQGETQSGKTNLLRHAIPWYRRWTIWPLSMVCWRGIYMNGGESQRMDTFQQWVTFQMFGTSHRAGSEIKQCVWAYRRQQWLCLMLEKLRVPFPLLLPKPVFIIVDQFEELLKRHPDQAMAWADAICHNHGRNNYARILFVVNSDYGAQSLLNLATHGLQFERIQMQKPTERWRLAALDRKLLQKCQHNVGLYWMAKQRLKSGALMPSEVEPFALQSKQRWARDFAVPFPQWPHPEWFHLELVEAKKELLQGLFALLQVETRSPSESFQRSMAMLALVRRELELLDSTQLFDTSMAEWARILSNEGCMKVLLTQQEARVVAKHLRRLMGHPVGFFGRSKAQLVWLPQTGLQSSRLRKKNGHRGLLGGALFQLFFFVHF
ncbi:unnamed protein product [Cladocopium goreaui]|uniref:Uncharacterized protein n=1 Tax=Cladocopium goreaui TaxID=2562237 RepID=A0A9P1FVI1_9DINO|nr:unnamed protein product [Cladocopium goreaui]